MKKYSSETEPRIRNKARLRFIRDITDAAIASMNLSPIDIKRLEALRGLGNHCDRLIASDLPATYRAGTFIERWFLRDRQNNPDRRYFFLTVSHTDFLTNDSMPVLSIQLFKRKVNNTLRKLPELSGMLRLEMQGVCQYEDGHRIIIPHFHGLAWTDDPSFNHTATMNALNCAGHWHSSLGGRPIDIIEIARTEEDTRRTSHYLAKQPDSAKNRGKRRDGTPVQRDTRAGYRPNLALRIIEGLSQIPMADTYIGFRSGRMLRRDLMKYLRGWHAGRPKQDTVCTDFDVWAFWYRLRQSHGSSRLAPWRVDSLPMVKRSAQLPVAIPEQADADVEPAPTPAPVDTPADDTEFVDEREVGFLDDFVNEEEDDTLAPEDPTPSRRRSSRLSARGNRPSSGRPRGGRPTGTRRSSGRRRR